MLSATSGPHVSVWPTSDKVSAQTSVSLPCLRRPHIYRHNTQHAIKASAWYMGCVHTYRQCLSGVTSLCLRQFRVVSDVCPALCLSSMGLLDPVRAFFGLMTRTTYLQCRSLKLSTNFPIPAPSKALPMSGSVWRPFRSALLGLFVTAHITPTLGDKTRAKVPIELGLCEGLSGFSLI